MAKIAKMPNEAIISGFKGVVDFYFYMGIPCARAWPRAPAGPRAPGVIAAQIPFTEAIHLWGQASQTVRDAYRLAASATSYSGYELFIQGYIKGIYHRDRP